MLRDILRRVTPDKAYLDLAPQMQRITLSLLSSPPTSRSSSRWRAPNAKLTLTLTLTLTQALP